MSETKERPILFSPKMIRAILAGNKSQTRRIMKPQPTYDGLPVTKISPLLIGIDYHKTGEFMKHHPEYDRVVTSGLWCPKGRPRDHLWVKEGWRPTIEGNEVIVRYLADGAQHFFGDGMPPGWTIPKAAAKGNVTSLFMPRWASRITLEVTEVRCERLTDISYDDCEREGITPQQVEAAGNCIVNAYAELWDSINGKTHPWESNPWVWAISFRKIA